MEGGFEEGAGRGGRKNLAGWILDKSEWARPTNCSEISFLGKEPIREAKRIRLNKRDRVDFSGFGSIPFLFLLAERRVHFGCLARPTS